MKCSRFAPVFGSNVATGISGDSTAVNDNTQDDKANASTNLYDAKNELDFSVSLDAEELDGGKKREENSDPHANVDVVAPELDGDTSCGDFKRQNNQPSESIVPANCEAPIYSD